MPQEIYKLANGITVILENSESVETVAVVIKVGVGSRHETKEENGISHFLEHMAFKGTKKRTSHQINKEFDMIGSNVNAYTSKTETVYHAKVLKEHVSIPLEIFSDTLKNSTLEQKEIEIERGAILQEYNQTQDTPMSMTYNYLDSIAYKDDPLGMTIIGTIDNIKRFNRDDFVNYVNKHYVADNITISIAGNFEVIEVKKLIEDYFGEFRGGGSAERAPAKYTGGYLKQEKDIEQTNVLLALPTYPITDSRKYTVDVIASILGSGMSSRLCDEMREKRGLAYSTWAYSHVDNDAGLLYLYLGTDEEKVPEAIKIMCEQLVKVIGTVTDDELMKTKNTFKANLVINKENPMNIATANIHDYCNYNRIIPAEEVMKIISNITKEDIYDCVRDVLTKDQPSVISYGKSKTLPDFKIIKNYLKI